MCRVGRKRQLLSRRRHKRTGEEEGIHSDGSRNAMSSALIVHSNGSAWVDGLSDDGGE